MPEQLRRVFESLIDSFTQADKREIIPADTVRSIQHLIMREYEFYQAASTPYGDTMDGFVIWLDSANRLTPSA
jgi:hypothetical protein